MRYVAAWRRSDTPRRVWLPLPGSGIVLSRISSEAKAATRAPNRCNTEILRAHLRALPHEARELLREEVGTLDNPGELVRAARLADADAIRERLRMATTQSPAGDPPSERPPPRPAAATGRSRASTELAGEPAESADDTL